MRIVIDMQGAQTESRFRGIGRYTLSFAQAVVRNRGAHEVIIALNGMFASTIEPIRAAFDGLLPSENIRVWSAPGSVCEQQESNKSRRNVAELIREAFLASLLPDVVHVTSLFEGYIDDAVTSIDRLDLRIPTTVTLYDLIPLLNPSQYLIPNSPYTEYYHRKLKFLKKASRLLAISEYARSEGVEHLGVQESAVINVSTAIDPEFNSLNKNQINDGFILDKFELRLPFVLYTGGADERKNLARLIQAYAALPRDIRRKHHLVFAGKMPEANVFQLHETARDAGMDPGELVMLGYVSDEELTCLYEHCALFVFPSGHEGFGLPPLEAMACGAPTIGSNVTSIPEVIGLSEAMFNPEDVPGITNLILKTLTDGAFRSLLIAHGLKQSKKFSWDETAQRALAAWDSIPLRQPREYIDLSLAEERLYTIIAGSELNDTDETFASIACCIAQNQQSGTERQLFLDVSELCQHDAATGVQRVVRSYLKWMLQSPPAGFRVEPVFATPQNGYCYARKYTQRFLGKSDIGIADTPIRWIRGDVFFGLDLQHHVQIKERRFYQQLMQEGVAVKFLVYDLLPLELGDLFQDENLKGLHQKLLETIAMTDGAICISKATSAALQKWIDDNAVPRSINFKNTWVHIGADIEESSQSRGLPDDFERTIAKIDARTTFLCVSTIEPRKCQQQILEAVEKLWARSVDVNLVLVGRRGWKTEKLVQRLLKHPEIGQRLFWLEGISDEYLKLIYENSACLIAASVNEGFGLSLIEAARYGIPIIARDIPVFREVAGDGAFYFEGNSAGALAESMKVWLELHARDMHPKSGSIEWSTWEKSTEKVKLQLVSNNRTKQLFVDISELVHRDAKSGIQRVVRSILREWLIETNSTYRIEPVYASHVDGYRYARSFMRQFLNVDDDTLVADEYIEYAPGDVFLGLDLAPAVVPAQKSFYKLLQRNGVKVVFVIYDLLPLMEGLFEKGHADACARWLAVAANGDAAICISEAVANELKSWMKRNNPESLLKTKVHHFHLGADIETSMPTLGLPENANETLNTIKLHSSFLQVSTLAPHKGHAQVLDAFELLWKSGKEVNLVVVGKAGWLVDSLVERLRIHPELNKRLFWLEGISDEYLEKIYNECICLIAASYGEGFGLPLIEAAQHNLPIIARDIPVFREVACDCAYYFEANSGEGLAEEISNWMSMFENGDHPKSTDMQWLTWKESAGQLSRYVFDGISGCDQR